MGALTQDRNTPERDGKTFVFPVAAGKVIYAGALVAMSASGYATPGATATTLRALGRAEENVSNAAGADGDVSVKVLKGTFRFGNSAAADAIALADVGATCYIVDDQTVAKTSGTSTRSVAGIVLDVDAAGVWVKI